MISFDEFIYYSCEKEKAKFIFDKNMLLIENIFFETIMFIELNEKKKILKLPGLFPSQTPKTVKMRIKPRKNSSPNPCSGVNSLAKIVCPKLF